MDQTCYPAQYLAPGAVPPITDSSAKLPDWLITEAVRRWVIIGGVIRKVLENCGSPTGTIGKII